MENRNKDVNTTREQPHIPSDHEDYVDVSEEDLSNMRMEGNSAYNVAMRPTQGEAARPREQQRYINHSEQFYEEIPADRVEIHRQPTVETREAKPVSTKALSPGNALCSFWQGKLEIAIRMAIVVVSDTLL